MNFIPDAKTRVFGIIGYPLGHTLSPAMHNAAFRSQGINAVYLSFPMQQLIGLRTAMKLFSIRGLSVTIPHKEKIRNIADRTDPLSMEIGSLNTLYFDKHDLLTGTNTDGPGAVQAITESGFRIADKDITILGSGGSARAIAMTLMREKPRSVTLVGRNQIALQSLARNLKLKRNSVRIRILTLQPVKPAIRVNKYEIAALVSPDQLAGTDLMIHTTPCGMSGHPDAGRSFLSPEMFPRGAALFDIVYNPAWTPLMITGRKRGAHIIPGYKMLLYQGVRQYELFTGQPAPAAVMEKALLSALRKAKS